MINDFSVALIPQCHRDIVLGYKCVDHRLETMSKSETSKYSSVSGLDDISSDTVKKVYSISAITVVLYLRSICILSAAVSICQDLQYNFRICTLLSVGS